MIKVNFNGDIKELSEKPFSFTELCYSISKLYNIKNSEDLPLEYLSTDNKYIPLTLFNYQDFYINNNQEENIKLNSLPSETIYNINQINDDETEKISNINSITEEENPIVNNEEKEIPISEHQITKDEVMNSIIKKQKAKMDKAKKEREAKERKEKNIEKARMIKEKKELEKQKLVEKKQEKKFSNDINEIITKKLAELKKELINKSNIQLSQIMKEINIKNNEEIKEEPESAESHYGISCSGCGKCPIEGVRYKCVYCENIDYCEECEKEQGDIHEHPLYKLKHVIN